MTHTTRATASAAGALSAAALLLCAAVPAASAASAHTRTERIPFTEATVTAQAAPGTYEIAWKAPGVRRVAIRANGRTVASGGSSGKVTVSGLPATADRQWFDLAPDHGRGLHLADRLIQLDGAVNFRDAGGYRTRDGHWVKMGEVYRSDALNNLTSADLAKLKRLGIDTDFDLRTASERAAAPDRVPPGTRYVVADVLAGSDLMTTLPTTEAGAVAMMTQGEKFMVSGDTAKSAYTKVFSGLTGGDSALFHCTAGKDRTGWANAALLTALGVPRETVMKDYLASNDYRAAANAAALAAMPPEQAKVYKPLLDVRAEYLNSGFDEVRAAFGSFEAYERQALGVTAPELRSLKRQLLV
ncbi:tyrosine-protein phosphatase [Streptomyces sp. VRA16 Mangrove soil]|uniref:tyrosine-protein phosphatase n=1 Tax=Streptomyces sp. VRA16 Mangrove soil TaxID=2817434 RepID=UPI001A9E7852|nr:tyrosine-protein phosphatase [Streptomyces sp. VRA16 Mangrove soil]MBO1337138.1 tyrosine-protein phosphatase [Streptomyces sp. VRA16 Mangrove soil]